MSTTLKNIKIAYPTEGVVRSAQLNDTVCPENSVQLAVNMDFDRVGAIKTRPGITKYADDLVGQIKSLGKLNNYTISGGYNSFIGMTPRDTFETTTVDFISSAKIDDTHVILFWRGVNGDGFAQVMEFEEDTGSMIPLNVPIEFDASDGSQNKVIKVDSTHFMNLWSGASSHSYAQIFTVNLSSWEVTAEGSPFQFDATAVSNITISQVDLNHFITFYTSGGLGKTEVLAVNLGTWAVSAAGAITTFEATSNSVNSCSSLGDGEHFINFWSGPAGDGFAQAFSVNLGTWAVSAIGSALKFDTADNDYNTCASLGDGEHFINFWTGTGKIGLARVFNVNPSTFAVTRVGASNFTFDDQPAISHQSCVSAGDGQHFVNFWLGHGYNSNYYGYAQLFEVNLTTFDISAIAQPLSLGISYVGMRNNSLLLSSYNIVNFWKQESNVGVGALFKLQAYPVFNNLLYAQQGDYEIYNWDGANWTNVRSGLKTNQKARFSQFLNYLWMVNGNASIGDAVATSNGGAFGDDLVPIGLPPGDYIQAGFEGRIWIVDSLLDALYYTDIVQFTPPNSYSLSFDINVNYLKNFSTQNGEKITALWQVPRALLLFKENHIYRIYGANSVDSYPAYNVGTFSQESIVETKDGIYFHHSSGFYKFDYGSQPVEISRRIIDFVKAIPSTYYSEIVGEWDGFDSVKWYVGPVTVEGVYYSNCVVRYTISTQVWTIYNYKDNEITAMIRFDDGDEINQIAGTSLGKVVSLDTGTTDLGKAIHYEIIDRWRSFTDMYAKSKSVSGMNVYTENGAGMRVEYQVEKTIPDKWTYIDTVNENYDALFPNASTDDFAVIRFRYTGQNSGAPIIFHGVELLSIQDKGFDQN